MQNQILPSLATIKRGEEDMSGTDWTSLYTMTRLSVIGSGAADSKCQQQQQASCEPAASKMQPLDEQQQQHIACSELDHDPKLKSTTAGTEV